LCAVASQLVLHCNVTSKPLRVRLTVFPPLLRLNRDAKCYDEIRPLTHAPSALVKTSSLPDSVAVEFLKILLACVVAAAFYGVLNDLVTAHLCIEFFKLFPLDIKSSNPVVVAIVFGVLSTWWIGLLLGIIMASCARLGDYNRRTLADLLSPLSKLLIAIAAIAILSGFVAYAMAPPEGIPNWSGIIPPEKQRIAFSVNGAHLGAYASGAIGTVILCINLIVGRARPTALPDRSPTQRHYGSTSNMEPVTILSTISASLGLVDKFVGLVQKLRNPNAPTSHRVQAKAEHDTLVITRDGKEQERVSVKHLRLDQWDGVRFEALQRSVQSLWNQFHNLYAELPDLSVDERVRVKQRMETMRRQLCGDFQQMVDISQRVLGVPLGDHYSLYAVCHDADTQG
jgi:hypothetical protein